MPIISQNKRKALGVIFRGFEGATVPLDPDVQVWLDAILEAGGSVSTGEADAVNAYWIIQKAAGLEPLAIADYPMVGDRIAMEHNLKTPGNFRLDFIDTEPSQFTEQGWHPGPRPIATGNQSNAKIEFEQVTSPTYSQTIHVEWRGLISDITQGVIISQMGAAPAVPGWQIFNEIAGRFAFYIIDDNAAAQRIRVESQGSFNDGQPHDFIVDYDGSGFAAGVSFLVDGVDPGVSILADNAVGSPVTTAPLGVLARGPAGLPEVPGSDSVWNLKVTIDGVLQVDSLINEGLGLEVENTAPGQPDGVVLGNPWGSFARSYADTGLVPSSDTVLNDVSLEYYSRTDNLIGGQGEVCSANLALFLTTANLHIFDSYNITDGRVSSPSVDTLGQLIGSRRSAIDAGIYKNGIELGASTSGGGAPSDNSIYLGARNNGAIIDFFSTKQCAGAGIYAGVTSDQALHFYLAREAMNLRLGRSVSDAGRVLLEYIENVERVGGSLTDTEIRAVQAYLLELSEADILEGYLIADYPMLGGSEASNSISLFNNEDFNLEFFGGWVHSSTGALPDGSTAYANTKLVPFITLPLGSAMAEYYSRTDLPGNNSDVALGAQSNGNTNRIGMFLLRDNLTGRLDMWNTGEGRIDAATATSDGDFSISRIALDDLKVYKNGVLLDESLGSSIGVQPNIPIYIGARNNNGNAENFSNMECAGASIGLGFTEAQVLAHADARALMNQIAGRAV